MLNLFWVFGVGDGVTGEIFSVHFYCIHIMKSIRFNQQTITSQMINVNSFYLRRQALIGIGTNTAASLHDLDTLIASFICFLGPFLLFAERICNILWCSLIFIANTFTAFTLEPNEQSTRITLRALTSFRQTQIVFFFFPIS